MTKQNHFIHFDILFPTLESLSWWMTCPNYTKSPYGCFRKSSSLTRPLIVEVSVWRRSNSLALSTLPVGIIAFSTDPIPPGRRRMPGVILDFVWGNPYLFSNVPG